MLSKDIQYSIRKADPADVELLCEIGRTTFIEAYAAQNDAGNMRQYLAAHFAPQAVESEFKEVGSQYFVLDYEKYPVAYARTRKSEVITQLGGTAYAELSRLYVRQSHHGLGLGKALLHHCLDYLKADGQEVVWLGVWKENRLAIGFYEKAGFRIFGEHIFKFGNEDQADWIMRYDFGQTGKGGSD